MARYIVIPISILASFFLGVLIGGLGGQHAMCHQQYLDEYELVMPLIRDHPEFSHVEISESSAGGIALSGAVATESDLERLSNDVSLLIGKVRIKEAMGGVVVAKSGAH